MMSKLTYLILPCASILALHAALAGVDVPLPRTESGQPDLQGVWFYGTSTPFERPESLGNKKTYTPEESQQLLTDLATADKSKAQPLDPDREAPVAGALIAQEADHNFASIRVNPVVIDGQYRTSQIIEPVDGRLPFKADGKDFFQQLSDQGHGSFDGPEIRPASERCVGPNGGPMAPMVGWFYNANMQIVQTDSHVMILAEMNHDARIIPIGSAVSDSGVFPQWMGKSVGHWEGDTLVVETDGFRPEQSWFAFPMSDQLKVVERFTLVSKDEIHYEFTFSDPGIYSESITAEKNISRRAPGEEIFEYACHEGNYSMSSILAGARRQELDQLVVPQ